MCLGETWKCTPVVRKEEHILEAKDDRNHMRYVRSYAPEAKNYWNIDYNRPFPSYIVPLF